MGVQPELVFAAPHSELKEGLPYKMFLRACRSAQTRQLYKDNLNVYARWHAAKYGPMKLMDGTPREIEMRIIDYIEDMKALGRAYSTCWTHKSALKLYYDDIEGIRWKKISRYMPEAIKVSRDRAYTTEELRKLASMHASVNRYVVAMSSSGCRVGALPGLKMRDLELHGDIYAVRFYAGTKEEYTSFIYPAQVLENYFEERRRSGEPIGPDSPVFRDTYRRFHGKNQDDPRGVTTKAIKDSVGRYSQEAGLRVGNDLPKRCHGMRKRFFTQLTKVMPTLLADALLGHNLGLAAHYHRPKPEELEAAYRKAIPLIALDETELLKSKNNELKLENAAIERKVDRVAASLEDWTYVITHSEGGVTTAQLLNKWYQLSKQREARGEGPNKGTIPPLPLGV